MVSSSRVFRAVVLVLRVALGAVFAYAAWIKLRQPGSCLRCRSATTECCPIGPCGWWRARCRGGGADRPGAHGGALAASFGGRGFAAAAGVLRLDVRAYATGMEINCGCFGPGEAISVRTLVRDGWLLAVSLFLTWTSFRGRRRAA